MSIVYISLCMYIYIISDGYSIFVTMVWMYSNSIKDDM